MSGPPVCKVCGRAHWLSEPHATGAGPIEAGPYSSAAEHLPRKEAVASSNLAAGSSSVTDPSEIVTDARNKMGPERDIMRAGVTKSRRGRPRTDDPSPAALRQRRFRERKRQREMEGR